MYLTRIELNLEDARARADLADPYEMHRTLSRIMAPDELTPATRFLWRLEGMRESERPHVLLQTMVAPIWDRFDATHAGWVKDRATKDFDPNAFVSEGRALRFRLRANPTVTRAGKRHGLVREADQMAWMQRQSERHGFDLLACEVSETNRLRGRKKQAAPGGIVVLAVRFDGLLRVRSQEHVVGAMTNGIGHAKSLGLGLLSLAAAQM